MSALLSHPRFPIRFLSLLALTGVVFALAWTAGCYHFTKRVLYRCMGGAGRSVALSLTAAWKAYGRMAD